MSLGLVQAPDSKRYHITFDGYWPICNHKLGPLYMSDSAAREEGWRTPHGICSNCAREIESAVRLIAVEESRDV